MYKIDIFVVIAVPYLGVYFNNPKQAKPVIAFDNRKDANKYAEKKSQRAFDYYFTVKKITLEMEHA